MLGHLLDTTVLSTNHLGVPLWKGSIIPATHTPNWFESWGQRCHTCTKRMWKGLLFTSRGFLERVGLAFKPIHLPCAKDVWWEALVFSVGRRWGWGEESWTWLWVYLVWAFSSAPGERGLSLSYWLTRCGAEGEKGKVAWKLSAVRYQQWSFLLPSSCHFR